MNITLDDFPGIQFLDNLRFVVQHKVVFAGVGIEVENARVGFVGQPAVVVRARNAFPLIVVV